LETSAGTPTEEDEYPESYSRLVDELERVLSENISIKRTKSGSSRITIECANDGEVEALINKLSNIK
jgi:ParB family chromosome partitioning protein